MATRRESSGRNRETTLSARRSKASRAATRGVMGTAASDSAVTAARAIATAGATTGTALGKNNDAAPSADAGTRTAGAPRRGHGLKGDTMLALTYISGPHMRCPS